MRSRTRRCPHSVGAGVALRESAASSSGTDRFERAVSALRYSSAMRATVRRYGTSEYSATVFDSSAVQSTSRPSRIAPARSSAVLSLTQPSHLFRQADERPLRGLASGICRWFSEHLRQFLVAVTHLHTGHNLFPLLRSQP